MLPTTRPEQSEKMPTPDSQPGWMDWAIQQLAFTQKELRETLRDRRTIITLLLMPLLLYPLLGLGFRYLALQQRLQSSNEYSLVFEGEPEARWFQEIINQGKQFREEQRELLNEENAHSESWLDEESDSPRLHLSWISEGGFATLTDYVESGTADLGVRIEFTEQRVHENLPGAKVELVLQGDSLASRKVADYVEDCLQALNHLSLERWNESQTDSYQAPLAESSVFVGARESGRAILGMLPLILLLMAVTGGVYPAIDLTAGERERDTMEAIMALPVPAYRLLLAKYVAVVAMILITGAVNLVAMTATVYSMQLESLLLGEQGLTFKLVAKLCLVMGIFALFYSAVLLLVTCSARSFKEAQAYLIPLLLLSIAPGLVISLPGWTLNSTTATLPLVNMLLLGRGILEGTAPLLPVVIALLCTLLYGMLALAIASRLFGTDAVGASNGGQWGELIASPSRFSAKPSLLMAVGMLTLMVPLHFLASGTLGRVESESISERLIYSGLLTVLLFGLLPVLLLSRQKVRLKSGLGLYLPPLIAWPGAVLLGLTTWPWIFELTIWLNEMGLGVLREHHFKQVEELTRSWLLVPFPLVAIVLGVLPAICEEIFFRGLVMNGLRTKMSPWPSICLSAIAFGLFHVLVAGGAAPERVVPSTIMGLILGWVAWQTGSLLPAILLHGLHNTSLLAMARYQQDLLGWELFQQQVQHLPAGLLLGSAFCMLAGILLLKRCQPVAEMPKQDQQVLSASGV